MVTATQQGPIRKISYTGPQAGRNVGADRYAEGIFSPRYRRLLQFKCYQIVGNHHDAEDIVSRALSSMYETYMRGDFESDASAIAHVRSIKKLKWLCINFFRDRNRLKRRIKRAQDLGAIRLLVDVAFPETQRVELSDELSKVLKLVDELPDETQREIIQLRIQGLTFPEIKLHLNLPKSTTYEYARRAKAWLLAQLDPQPDAEQS
ncbi:RNA polymerase sigma factor [Planctomicrobium sp. SH527]|uniref:RNA polymerase sigma factor n=1 Tax=Planctomicrobium sp. SH527 TaxID=3448123 RepID=UPI003F5B43A9